MKATQPKETHKFLKLADDLRRQVRSGELRPGERLPTVAQMYAKYGIGQWTLERAYSVLESEKIVVRKPNCGFFVAGQQHSARTSRVIGVVCELPLEKAPYHSRLLEGVFSAANSAGVEVALLEEQSEMCWEKVDGVILTGHAVEVPLTMPVVTLTAPQKDAINIVADDFDGARQATRHLISLGHTRIAFLNLNRCITKYCPGQERLKGYQAALQEAGIEAKRNWVRALFEPWDRIQPFSVLGHEKIRFWLEEDWHRLGCTALLVYNDETAQGALRALQEGGLSVPEDVSVMGFDGTSMADCLTPRLSTIEVPLREIGRRGLELMMEIMHEPIEARRPDEVKGYDEMFPTQLKIQESTARLN